MTKLCDNSDLNQEVECLSDSSLKMVLEREEAGDTLVYIEYYSPEGDKKNLEIHVGRRS